MPLTLEIVTPRGVAFRAKDLDRVVLRRAENRFELGSELVIMPRHGELMIRLAAHTIRVRSGRETTYIQIEDGFAEAYNDGVTILTRAASVVATEQAGCVEVVPG